MNEGGVGLREGDLLNGTRVGEPFGEWDLDLEGDLLLRRGDLELESDLRGDLEEDRGCLERGGGGDL